MKAGAGANREKALERRREYIRLRVEGADPWTAAHQLGVPDGVQGRYERWARAEHPELGTAQRPDWRYWAS